MRYELEEVHTEIAADVVVIGGGLAGLAATIHLRRAGFSVICLEPRERFAEIVGESLDWSAPGLLAQLGLPMEMLVERGAATFKRHVGIISPDGLEQEYHPGSWLEENPWNVELRTLHLDRQQLHSLLVEAVRAVGGVAVRDRAVGIERREDRIQAVITSGQRRIDARWVIDASGAAASLLAREFKISSAVYGPRKTALWGHFPTKHWQEGTTLYALSGAGEYMEWLWEIPIRPGVSSIGYVAPGSRSKQDRAAGLSKGEMLARQARKFPRLGEIYREFPLEEVAATSFLCRTYKRTCGSNWFIIGEAASQSDPITGNGVTAALRHAEESSALIARHRNGGRVPLPARMAYSWRVEGVGRYFNSLIEKLYYEAALRSQLGLFHSAEVYTIPAWTANLVYSRLRPCGLLGTMALCSALVTLRGLAWTLFKLSRLTHRNALLLKNQATAKNVQQNFRR